MNPDHTKRTSHTQLPTGDEIMHISAAEEKRQLLLERETAHFPDFATIKEIYAHYGLDTHIFDEPNLTAQYILDTGAKQIEELIKRIMGGSVPEDTVSLLKNAYAYLSEEDEVHPADYIFVFGAKTPFRIQKAIELYKRNLAPSLILTGRGPFYGKDKTLSEAEQYAEIAREAGISDAALILEPNSITVPDNVRRTLNMLDKEGAPYQSFIIVNSPYTQRRGWCSWKKHTPESVAIYRVNCKTGPNFTPDAWYRNEDGLRVVLGEFIKMRETMAFNDA